MIIYRDIITGDEIISDAYDIKPIMDGLWEVDCKNITIGGETFDTGANASAEEAEEGLEDGTSKVIDVVHSFKLQEYVPMDKKAAQKYYKGYAKAVSAKLKEQGKDEQREKWEKTAPAALKAIFGNWGKYDIYLGESGDGDNGKWVLINYRDDGITPYATVLQYAMEEYKV